jgi:NTE family protein
MTRIDPQMRNVIGEADGATPAPRGCRPPVVSRWQSSRRLPCSRPWPFVACWGAPDHGCSRGLLATRRYRRLMVDSAPRVALVLGAGGVAGAAFHAGVLAALAEVTGWDPRSAAVVVGTSAGSVTGATLRAGLPAADLLARARDRPLSPEGQQIVRRLPRTPRLPSLRQAPQARPPRQLAATLARAAGRPLAARPWSLIAALMPEGSASTEAITAGIGAILPDEWPEDPLLVCAVRRSDGRRVVFGGGDDRPSLPHAVAASCAIPGFFRPVMIDGEAHIDGGVHSPTNADVLVRTPLDLVIISSPMSRQARRPRLTADQPMRTWARALLEAEVLRLRRRRVAVLAVQPDDDVLDVMGLNAMDPLRRTTIALAARDSMRRRLARPTVAERLELLHP